VKMHAFGDRRNPVLVFLHGIGTGHRLWLRQIDQFQRSHFRPGAGHPWAYRHDGGISKIGEKVFLLGFYMPFPRLRSAWNAWGTKPGSFMPRLS
jgi:hypothetical protein